MQSKRPAAEAKPRDEKPSSAETDFFHSCLIEVDRLFRQGPGMVPGPGGIGNSVQELFTPARLWTSGSAASPDLI